MSESEMQHNPKHILGGGFSLAVIIGGVIGLGILGTPGEIAEVIQNPWLFVAVWFFGGLFVLLTASVVAELVGMTPRSGGTYSLVRRAYGPFPGFVIGWVDWLSFVSDIALKAVAIVVFAKVLFPAMEPWQTPLAIGVTTVFAALQLKSVTLGATIQQIAAAVMALIVIGFTLALLFGETVVSSQATTIPEPATVFAAWSVVFAAIIYSYDGWSYPAYFSGEIKGGSKAVAHSCIKGVLIIIPLYVLLMAALAWKVPLSTLAGEEHALVKALEMAVSPEAASVVLIASIVIVLTHQNLLYMSAPRILQAMAEDGLATKRAGEISEGGNPVFSVLLCWVVSVAMIWKSESFESLLRLTVFFFMFTYVVLIVGVLILRARHPETDRPYRAWGHPWSTYICLCGWIAIGLLELVTDMKSVLYAVLMIAICWPVYWFMARYKSE